MGRLYMYIYMNGWSFMVSNVGEYTSRLNHPMVCRDFKNSWNPMVFFFTQPPGAYCVPWTCGFVENSQRFWDEFQWTFFLVRNDLNVWIPLTVYQFHLLNSLGKDVKFCRFVPYDIFRNKQPQMVPEDLNWFPGFGFDWGPNLQPWMWEYQQSLRSRNLSIEFEGRSWSCAVPTDIETHEHHVLHLVNTIQPYDLYSLCIYLYTNLDFFQQTKNYLACSCRVISPWKT